MGRRTSSIAQKKRALRKDADERMQKAIEMYRTLENALSEKLPSIRSVAIRHKVSASTLARHLKGGIPMSEFNASKRHLTKAEERVLLEFLKDQARRGFPLSHRLLEEKTNAILRVRKGADFNVGKAWISRFLEIHAAEISVYWSRGLERKRCNGLTEMAVNQFYEAVDSLDRKYEIPEGNWYAADESGIMMGVGTRTEVIGPAGQRVQHKRQDGEREIVTVLETICADGSTLKPTVVFKGKNLLKKWGEDNPCEASIGVGPNGYMDTELALQYLEDFHQQTKDKNNLPRVLLLDGHSSHTSLAFLNRAADLNIFVVSYPPHTTHALQGLDVVIFSVLKRHWQAIRDAHERAAGLPMKKQYFLRMYTAARTATLTPELVKQAFRKTGTYPVNRNAISSNQLAPSFEDSVQTVFPANLASPVKVVLAANSHRSAGPIPSATIPSSTEASGLPSSIPSEAHHPVDPTQFSPSQRAKTMNFLLEKTSASYLIDLTKALADFDPKKQRIPAPVFEKPADALTPNWSLLHSTPPTQTGQLRPYSNTVLSELGRAKALTSVLESCLEASNAQLVLAHMEIQRLRAAVQETKALGKTMNRRAKLMSSGMARLLTSEEFRAAVRKDEEVAQAKVIQQTAGREARVLKKAKKAWRDKDIAERKRLRAKQKATWAKACERATSVGQAKPKLPKAPIRPHTPDDDFFLGLETTEDEDGEEIDLEEADDDEEEED